MKILADDKIPLVKELFEPQAEVIQKPGPEINSADLKEIDLLLVRTVTQVNEALLHNSRVRFVGSATAGIDHLDIHYLQSAGITWFSAQGANAPAVVNYVLGCVAALQQAEKLHAKPRIGIIGVGAVGTRVAHALAPMASEIVLNDPPRAAQEGSFISTPLSAFAELDLISLHTPLTKTGVFPSYHLLDAIFLKQLKPSSVLINTARGGVIDEQALMHLKALPTLCLDVWENEPLINLQLLQECFIATPHIAGYSLAAKTRATKMLYQHFSKLLNWPELNEAYEQEILTSELKQKTTANEILAHYDPRHDSASMKARLLHSQNPAVDFENLRRGYCLRKEF